MRTGNLHCLGSACGSMPALTIAMLICPSVLVQDVIDLLRSLHKEAAVPGQYLRAALAELRAAAVMHSTQLPPALNILDLEAAVQLGQGSQVPHKPGHAQLLCCAAATAPQRHEERCASRGDLQAHMHEA